MTGVATNAIGDWYDAVFTSTGRSPALWLFVGFVLAFVVTRTITRHIRAKQADAQAQGRTDGGGFLSNVHIGGVHVHHQVWGILLALVAGLLEFRFDPDHPWVEVLALVFGGGAAMALDEFALWLHLDDVYWTAEGRKSIDAILVAVAIAVAMLVQVSPIGITGATVGGRWATAGVLALHFALVVVSFLKGKRHLGIIGVVVPGLAIITAARLAKPTSFWARRYYKAAKLERARSRFSEVYQRRWDRFRDWIGGAHVHVPPRIEAAVEKNLGNASESPDEPPRADRGPAARDADRPKPR